MDKSPSRPQKGENNDSLEEMFLNEEYCTLNGMITVMDGHTLFFLNAKIGKNVFLRPDRSKTSAICDLIENYTYPAGNSNKGANTDDSK